MLEYFVEVVGIFVDVGILVDVGIFVVLVEYFVVVDGIFVDVGGIFVGVAGGEARRISVSSLSKMFLCRLLQS